jgi:hypothetical protein
MTQKTIIVRSVSRFDTAGVVETIDLTPGVNVLVGPPNTGKSVWLNMIDYVLGSKDKPTDAFNDEITSKYKAIRMFASIGDGVCCILRKWGDQKDVSKIFLNGTPLTVDDFYKHLMSALDIPILSFPQGNPYGLRSWRELNWRSLLRHIYRKQAYWGDIADRQPESEQHACLMQFLGLAGHLFSDDYGQLIGKQREIIKLESQKEQFLSLLHELSQEIMNDRALGVALTPQSIEAAIDRVSREVVVLDAERESLLRSLVDSATSQEDSDAAARAKGSFEKASEQFLDLQARQQSCRQQITKANERLQEVLAYKKAVEEELGRMQRTQAASNVLSGLRVTHCPACDLPVQQKSADESHCHVCGQDAKSGVNHERVTQRVAFEIEQLKGELLEANDLIIAIRNEVQSSTKLLADISDELTNTTSLLHPVRSIAAQILPPEVSFLAVQSGHLQERLNELQRVKKAFKRRDEISQQIEEIERTVAELEAKVEHAHSEVDFEKSADILRDGINSYLNLINQEKPNAWSQAEVSIRFKDREFAIRVAGTNWRKLGGTLSLYFLIGYHYALMTLMSHPECHFPGLCILDFPAQLEGTSVADRENFVLEPFVELLSRQDMGNAQVIAAGSAFDGLPAANRIELTNIWK